MKRKLTMIGIVLVGILLLVSLIRFATDRVNLAKEEKVLAEFEALTEYEDITVAELSQFLDEKVDRLSQEKAALLVTGLERVQRAKLPQWEKKFENEGLQQELARVYQETGWRLSDFSSITDAQLREIVEEAIDNGYKVETAEGFFFPVIDYTFYDKYHTAVTPDLAVYYEIMAVESEQAPVKDAALMIPWEEVLNRALRQEEFLMECNSSPQVPAIEKLLKQYVSFALFGCNNTPLFSYDTKKMNSEAKAAYLKYDWDEAKGSFSRLIKEYLKVLKKNDYRLTPDVEEFRKDAVAKF